MLSYMVIMFFATLLSGGSSSSIACSFEDQLIIALLFGPLMWFTLLVYPGIFLAAMFTAFRYIKIRLSPSLISSTLIFYALSLITADSVFHMFKKGEHAWQTIVLAAISSAAGYAYANYRSPGKK
jgi:hypothetical protein